LFVLCFFVCREEENIYKYLFIYLPGFVPPNVCLFIPKTVDNTEEEKRTEHNGRNASKSLKKKED
jgi:hypothetical protein